MLDLPQLALSVRQPWAWAIIHGGKPLENRSQGAIDYMRPLRGRRAIHAAKVQIGRSGRHVGQEAVQLHGGIGVTMEYSVGHYFKRVTVIERQMGDTESHLAALARLGGLIAA